MTFGWACWWTLEESEKHHTPIKQPRKPKLPCIKNGWNQTTNSLTVRTLTPRPVLTLSRTQSPIAKKDTAKKHPTKATERWDSSSCELHLVKAEQHTAWSPGSSAKEMEPGQERQSRRADPGMSHSWSHHSQGSSEKWTKVFLVWALVGWLFSLGHFGFGVLFSLVNKIIITLVWEMVSRHPDNQSSVAGTHVKIWYSYSDKEDQNKTIREAHGPASLEYNAATETRETLPQQGGW